MNGSLFKSLPPVAIGAILLFLITRILDESLTSVFSVYAAQNYLPMHILLEFFSIAISLGIAYQGWIVHPYTSSRYRLWLGALFLSVGILDLVHTLTFKGMPYFFAESSAAKATWYWVLARLTEASGLFLIFLRPDCAVPKSQRIIPFITTILWSGIIIFVISAYCKFLPSLLLETTGLTPLKIGLEYFINLLHICAVYFLWHHSKRQNNTSCHYLISALVVILLGEQIFTSYTTPYDFDNFLGHVYKAVGYMYLLRGIYVVTIEEPLQKQQETATQLRLTAIVFNNSLEAIVVTDSLGKILAVNPAFTTITGYQPHEVIGRQSTVLRSNRHSDQFYANIWYCLIKTGHWKGEVWSRRKDGKVFAEGLTISAVKDDEGHTDKYVGVFSDITARKEYELQIKYQAFHDALTGLPNRAMFYEQANCLIAEYPANHQPFALFFMDIDGFKQVNDTYGHDSGDILLQQISHRLQICIGKSNLLFRWGGDEFILLASKASTSQDIEPITQQIFDCFTQPFLVDKYQVHVTTSIGVSFYPLHGASPDDLLKKADAAMYVAKNDGKNRFVIFR